VTPEILYYFYLFVLFTGTIVGIINLKFFDPLTKIIFILLFVTGLSEVICRITYHLHYGKNMVYHFDCIIESLLITIYFIKTIRIKNSNFWIFFSIIAWPILGTLNCIFFQPLKSLDSNIIFLENFSIITMSLYALYSILLNENLTFVIRHPHFWFWTCFLILSCGTFFFWAYLVISNYKGKYLNFLQYFQVTVNILVYAVIALVFLYYPKKFMNES